MNGTSPTTLELSHILAKVNWYQENPRKLSRLSQGIFLSAIVLESYTSASVIPVSRIISRCTIKDCYQDFGYDHVKVVIPLKQLQI